MKRETKLLGIKDNFKITAPVKWWRSMERYKKLNIGLRAIINYSKFISDQKRIEKEYNLNEGETLGV